LSRQKVCPMAVAWLPLGAELVRATKVLPFRSRLDGTMNSFCGTCGSALYSQAARFCSRCGASSVNHDAASLPPHTSTNRAPVQGLATGIGAGIVSATVLAGVGALLCVTGIGAIIGLPMILAGFVSLFMGPVIGLGAMKAPCPWCGTSVKSPGWAKGFRCPACRHQIVVRGKAFLKII
jgi:DNA-directed RNA polymerase subunit RPC12/RpoP